MFSLKKVVRTACAAVGLVGLASAASAHVWTIGWDSVGGGLVFYGVSYHTPLEPTLDDFTANPAGFVINGTNLTFDLGSVVDLNDCNDGTSGLTTGTCEPTWNALGLDGAIASTSYPNGSGSTYGKYATATITAGNLSTYGIGQGANSVTLSTFANNATWAGLPFSSASVPLNIIVKPPTGVIPLPAGAFLLPVALGGLAFFRRRKHAG